MLLYHGTKDCYPTPKTSSGPEYMKYIYCMQYVTIQTIRKRKSGRVKGESVAKEWTLNYTGAGEKPRGVNSSVWRVAMENSNRGVIRELSERNIG